MKVLKTPRSSRQPVVELVSFAEQEQDALSKDLGSLGVEPFWSGKAPRSDVADLRVVRMGAGSVSAKPSRKKIPLAFVTDFRQGLGGILQKVTENEVVWVGAWTADTFALARRIASVAHRLLEIKPPLTGPRPAAFFCDAKGVIRQMSPSAAARLGGIPSDFNGNKWIPWLEKGRRALVQGWLKTKLFPYGQGISDCLVHLPNKRWTFWDIWLQPFPGGFSVHVTDESERRELGDQLEYALTHDPLTGFINRWELRRQMDRHSRAAGGVLLVADLDDFKIYNDTRGHDEGDEMLRRVARRLRDHFGPEAELSRLGGDEFAIFLKNWTLAKATRKARSLVSFMAHRRSLGGSSAEPSISVALVRSARGDPPNQVFRAADAGLQRAKVRGKSRVEVVKEMRVSPPSIRSSWTLEVSQALQAGEFELWLQPIRELKNGRVVFHEALFRLWTPSGLAMPGATLSAVDRLGMRIHLATLVIHRCLALLKRDPQLVLSANVGREVLSDADLAHDLVSSMRRAGISPQRLILEISEETGMAELRAGKHIAKKLHKAGFCLSLDDYGRGSSSLVEIIELPVCQVKLDPILWRGARRNKRARYVLEKLLRLFRDLKIKVIAEGVAQRSELTLIRSLGIPQAQGFELGRPRAPKGLPAINPRGRPAHLSLPKSSDEGSADPLKPRSLFRPSEI